MSERAVREFCKGRHLGIKSTRDVLQCDGIAEASGRGQVTNISEFTCRDGTLYLAGTRWLRNLALVVWSMRKHQTIGHLASLVTALAPWNPSVNTIHHANHEAQHASIESSADSTTVGSSAATAASADT